jgi:hypothetical protein
MTEDAPAATTYLQWFRENLGAFGQIQDQQSLTWAHALADSPAGLIGWNGQLFGDVVDIEFALMNLTFYWLTGTSASSARLYYENAHVDAPTEPATVPIGLAAFAGDFKSIRRFVDRDHKDVVSWHEYAIGGHYAAHQAPDLLVAGVRGFCGELLADRVDT